MRRVSAREIGNQNTYVLRNLLNESTKIYFATNNKRNTIVSDHILTRVE